MRLKNKIAIVTGGASGIGKGIVDRFCAEGAHVFLFDVDEEAGKSCEKPGSQVHFIATDVSDPASVSNSIEHVLRHAERIDVIVNNAGIISEQAPTVECSLENWQRVLRVDLDGVFYGMKFGIKAMLKNAEGGSIVNMGSVSSLVGFKNMPPYSAAKGAIMQMTKSAAIEYAQFKIRVNLVCPTAIATPLIERYLDESPDPAKARKEFESVNPLPGIPVPADVANAALFLASDEARFVTGVTLPVDGGYTAQ